MYTDLIIISEYCKKTNIEPSFISMLEEDGLINIEVIGHEQYILTSQLNDLEKYSRLYYDLSINVPGISAVNHLLDQIHEQKKEIQYLRSQLSTIQSDIWDDME